MLSFPPVGLPVVGNGATSSSNPDFLMINGMHVQDGRLGHGSCQWLWNRAKLTGQEGIKPLTLASLVLSSNQLLDMHRVVCL